MNLFRELRLHGKLAARRNPMYGQNRMGRVLLRVGTGLSVAYLAAAGIGLGLAADRIPGGPEGVEGKLIPAILLLDFLLRMSLQNTPTQEVKPYLLLPVSRLRLVQSLLLRSGLSFFNLLWFSFFLPYLYLRFAPQSDFGGMGGCCVLLYLFFLINNYWALLCKMLVTWKAVWVVLPMGVYAAAGMAVAKAGGRLPDVDWWMFPALAGLLAVLVLACGKVLARLIRLEVGKKGGTNVGAVREYRFLERFGETGEWMRLELKLLLRNKLPRNTVVKTLLIAAAFAQVQAFTSAYGGMQVFFFSYCYSVFAWTVMGQLMGYEGNYLDGLMVRGQSLLPLLRGKYGFYCLAEVIPFLYMLPVVLAGKLTWLGAFAWCLFMVGPVYCGLFFASAYNRETLPLNSKITRQGSGGSSRIMFITFVALLSPMLFYSLFRVLWNETGAYLLMSAAGLLFVLSSPWWLAVVDRRMADRRYRNLEGFRSSRQG